MPKLIKVTETKAVAPGKAAAFDVGGQRVAVFNVGGTFYAIEDTCTHDGGPLCEGEVEGTVVTCPWHRATFDLKNGDALGPPAFSGVKSFKVVVEGNDVKLEV